MYQNVKFGIFLEELGMENVGMYVSWPLLFLCYFGYMLRPFGIFGGNFGTFSGFGLLCQEKPGNPGLYCEKSLNCFLHLGGGGH
jgi:hypothetical protein